MTDTPNDEPTPDVIMGIGMGYRNARILHSAMELGVFATLGSEQMSADELGEKVGIHPRVRADFFDVLGALDLLLVDGPPAERRYANTPATTTFLIPEMPTYMGGMLEMSRERSYAHFEHLTEALQTGEPVSEIRSGDDDFFGTLYDNPDALDLFLRAMSGIQFGGGAMLSMLLPLAEHQHLCDVGGASGTTAAVVSDFHPHLQCTVFDLPPVAAVAEKHLAERGAERVDVVAGDFLIDPLPACDIMLMGNILHDWNEETKRMLIRKAADAVAPGGRFVAIEMVLDENRTENLMGLVNSMHMLVEFGDAGEYTPSQFDEWCLDAGFERTEVIPLIGPLSVAVAYR